MGKIAISITNGGLNRTSSNTDKYVGLIIEVTALPSGWTNDAVKQLAKVEDLIALNVLETGTASDKLIHYHVSEFFRLCPDGLLFVALTTDAFDEDKVDLITNENNNVRLIGFNTKTAIATTTQINALATKLNTKFTSEFLPIRCVLSGDDATIDPSTATNAERVMYDCAQDLTTGSLAKDVFDNNAGICMATGTILGLLAGRPIHQKISWVETGDISGNDWTNYGLIDGTTITVNYTQAQIEALEADGINIVRSYPRATGAYFSENRTATASTNDFALINYGRVVDKACALVYDALLPSVDRPAYVDATTGKLTRDTIEYLRATAYDAIQNNMIAGKSGNDVELSVDSTTGRLQNNAIYIDPDQDVVSNGQINVVIGIVPVGSSKILNVSIGLTTGA